MRVLKDQIFHRLKAYNITQVVDFITTRHEYYYIRRLIDVANNRTTKKQPSTTTPLSVVRTDADLQEDEMFHSGTGNSAGSDVAERKLFYQIATDPPDETHIPSTQPYENNASAASNQEQGPDIRSDEGPSTQERNELKIEVRNMFDVPYWDKVNVGDWYLTCTADVSQRTSGHASVFWTLDSKWKRVQGKGVPVVEVEIVRMKNVCRMELSRSVPIVKARIELVQGTVQGGN
ncbi:hypothetical protein WMY93_020600 [Mugilogobius chulae]|uniref:Uncharacterized protein n=1 Tax=Mugilogobius chulae TaxID=88201 RepID=A0AAW0N9X7_9GOBI